MPPKKKQQQIDLASLPQCKSTNIILHCKGKKSRTVKIIQRIYKEAEKFMFKVQKSQVLNHAKQKNIYVDPSTLNDKQKKDAKFMESINTQLSASVIAKSVHSLISTLNIKIRLQKKNNPNAFANEKRKYDALYVFQDFPQTKDEFEQISKVGQNVRYVVVIDPKLNWANAPELPQDQMEKNVQKGNEEQEEQDQQIKEYRQLLKKQQKIEEDNQYENQVKGKISKLKKLRSDSSTSSDFRNCTVSQLQVDIDPYNEQNSIQEIVNIFFENLNKLGAELIQYQQWKKDKKAEKMPQFDLKGEHINSKQSSIIEMLNSVALRMDPVGAKRTEPSNQQQQLLSLIDKLNKPTEPKRERQNLNSTQKQYNFFGANQTISATSHLQLDIRSNTRYPGIDRFQMPEIPIKSLEIRKKEQSQYSQFIGNKMSLQDFFRQVRILNFEQYIKQVDEERTYSFLDRIFEEHHNVDSLKRQLNNATQFNQYTTHTKYDQNTDQLYLIFLYRSNARRIGKKNWESNWKVIPNYQYWLKYFKNNQSNLNSQHFYDLDYQKIGNIQQSVKAYTLKSGENGAVVINKDYGVGNKVQKLLYSIKNELVFGVKNDSFFSSNGEVKVYHDRINSKVNEQGEETIIVLPKSTIRVLSKSGNIILQNQDEVRMITPEGYTVVYQKQGSLILHPNGGITYSPDTYINERGFGLKNGSLYRSHALQRTIEKGEIIKRDDGVVIVNHLSDQPSKWIKFGDGTEYKIEDGAIKIEKNGQPFVTCENKTLKVCTDQFNIVVSPEADYYKTSIQFKDYSRLKLDKNIVTVYQEGQAQSIQVDITNNLIKSNFDQEQLIVKRESSQFKCKNKILNPLEDEQKFNQQQSIATDYIQPRLFIINNDNTGIELISQKTLDLYLKQHSATIHKVYELPQTNRQEIHVINKFQTKNSKFITNELQVNLDVFNNTTPNVHSTGESHIAIKTLIKYAPFTQEGVNNINSIKQNHQIWKKSKLKQENQFGYRPRDDQITKAKIAQKVLIIKTRQSKPAIINSEKLKENGKNLFLKSLSESQSKTQKQMKEAQLRNQYMKKRDSVVQQYKKIPFLNQHIIKEDQPSLQSHQFLDHYFLTDEGKKALSEMPEWVFRPKQQKQIPELDPQIQNQLKNTNFNKEQENSQDRRERYDTVEVVLNPKREKQIYIKPSVFTQRDIDDERKAFEEEKKAYKYHQAKRKDFGLYGQQRKAMPQVKTLLRSQAISQINQKYLVTEAPLDKKVKISSMKNKLTSSACNMTQMRKQGPHSLLIKTLDKGNDINKLLQKRTMMVQADLNDKLQRDILINPVEATFGVIMQRKTYQFKIEIKNQDVISQRITLKRPKNTHVKVALSEMGPIAMGMTRKIIVTIQASPEILGKFTDEFDIVTKHQIYHIPISAHIVSQNQVKTESLVLNRGVVEVNEYKKKSEATLQLPRIK